MPKGGIGLARLPVEMSTTPGTATPMDVRWPVGGNFGLARRMESRIMAAIAEYSSWPDGSLSPSKGFGGCSTSVRMLGTT